MAPFISNLQLLGFPIAIHARGPPGAIHFQFAITWICFCRKAGRWGQICICHTYYLFWGQQSSHSPRATYVLGDNSNRREEN